MRPKSALTPSVLKKICGYWDRQIASGRSTACEHCSGPSSPRISCNGPQRAGVMGKLFEIGVTGKDFGELAFVNARIKNVNELIGAIVRRRAE